jgi:hypothetical protein
MLVPEGSSLYSSKKGKDWIEKILPQAWDELCTQFEIRAGVVVLKSWEEDSFFESATFGYDEDGFYYPFLSRGESGLALVKKTLGPVAFFGNEVPLFCSQGRASVLAIRIPETEEFVGFLLAEWEDSQDPKNEPSLYLFAEKIGKERGDFRPRKMKEFSQADVPSRDFSPLVAGLVPALQQRISALSSEGILSIFGAEGSGKKTLTKWVHHETRPNTTCLFLSSIPEHLGKLEKALAVWSEEAGKGSLVFLGAKKWSLGQQKIVMDWMASEAKVCQVIFVDSEEEPSEILPGFSKLLRKNPLQIPGFSYLEKSQFRNIILSLFRDLVQMQNRQGLLLEEGAVVTLLEKNYPNHFTDLKNTLLSGILKSKGNLIREDDLKGDISRLNLGVPDAEDLNLRSGIQALEREKILNAMRIFSRNQIRMAKALGISRGALQNKMKQLGLL